MKAFKRSDLKKSIMAHAKGTPVPGASIVDNENGTFTIGGLDAAGFPTDISSLATLTPAPVSSNPAVATVGAPTGMTFPVQAVSPGHTDIALTATFNAGTPPPLTDNAGLDVTGGGAVALVATLSGVAPRP